MTPRRLVRRLILAAITAGILAAAAVLVWWVLIAGPTWMITGGVEPWGWRSPIYLASIGAIIGAVLRVIYKDEVVA